MGATWDPVIDHTSFAPTAKMDLLNLSFSAKNRLTPIGTILCGEVFHTIVLEPGESAQIRIPIEASLLGISICAQARSFDSTTDPQLTNAIDAIIGNS